MPITLTLQYDEAKAVAFALDNTLSDLEDEGILDMSSETDIQRMRAVYERITTALSESASDRS